MPDTPLTDPAYTPKYPPVNGHVPGVVALWGPRSQLRWFDRFRGQIAPMPHTEWARFHCHSLAHRGMCCDSCLGDWEEGYDYGSGEYCCCYAVE